MSNEFLKFSGAARVYAKYAAVVDEMYEIFTADITAFLNALRDEMKSPEDRLEEKDGSAYRCWWIEGSNVKEDDDVPYVLIRKEDAQIVTPGLLTLEVYAEGDLAPYRQQLQAMLSRLQLPTICKKSPASGGWGHIFTVTISYGDNDDPAGLAAEPVLTLLKALDEAEQKFRNTPTSSPNPTSKKAT